MDLGSGFCASCGWDGKYAKPSLKLCPICNSARLNAIKALKVEEAGKRGDRSQNQRKQAVKSSRFKPRKPTGEWVLFEVIWKEREHICSNCLSSLGSVMQPCYFSHIKSKQSYPELRLVKMNIQLLCFLCHREYDQGTIESFLRRKKIIQTYTNEYGKKDSIKRYINKVDDKEVWEIINREGLANYVRLLVPQVD